MENEDGLAIWRSLVGDSDNDSDFERFTLEEIVKGEESDVDLDMVVAQDRLDFDHSIFQSVL